MTFYLIISYKILSKAWPIKMVGVERIIFIVKSDKISRDQFQILQGNLRPQSYLWDSKRIGRSKIYRAIFMVVKFLIDMAAISKTRPQICIRSKLN